MSQKKTITFIVPNYPTNKDPVYTFIKELICAIADSGYNCNVIAPQSITNLTHKHQRKRNFNWIDFTEKGNTVNIYQPFHAPFLNFKIFGLNLSGMLTKFAIKRAFSRLKLNSSTDILYAHFWHSGVIAGEIGRKYNLPVYVATGESKIWVHELFKDKVIGNSLLNIKGVIAVSSKNKKESIELALTDNNKISVIPNSINNRLFYKKNQKKVREKLGFSQEDFIVIFTGSFNHRKGVNRLSKALDQLEDVKSIFIGRGELEPYCEGILFKGKLPHNEMVDYLNAADVFVLPTLAEGCSNAIIEAMACGLPIISSKESFNDEILDESNSKRIDVMNINEIKNTITLLKNNQKLKLEMGNNSLFKAKGLDISNRAYKVIKFIEEKENQNAI